MGVLSGRRDGTTQSYSEEIRWYKLGASKGDAKAMLYVGHMYLSGDGVPPDLSEAAVWYRKSADLGQSIAIFNLRELHSKGNGARKSYEEAHFWLNLREEYLISERAVRKGT